MMRHATRPALACLAASCSSPGRSGARAEDRPNIIVILADDLGIETINCADRKNKAPPARPGDCQPTLRRARQLAVGTSEVAAWPDELLSRFAGVLLHGVDSDLEARLRRHAPTFKATGSGPGFPGMRAWLKGIYAGSTAPLQPLQPVFDWNEQRLTIPEGTGSRWLVLAETYSLYPGWSVSVDGVPAPLLRANAVATAVPLPDGARRVELRYVPDGLLPGLAISAATLAIAAFVLLRRPRRGATPTPVGQSADGMS